MADTLAEDLARDDEESAGVAPWRACEQCPVLKAELRRLKKRTAELGHEVGEVREEVGEVREEVGELRQHLGAVERTVGELLVLARENAQKAAKRNEETDTALGKLTAESAAAKVAANAAQRDAAAARHASEKCANETTQILEYLRHNPSRDTYPELEPVSDDWEVNTEVMQTMPRPALMRRVRQLDSDVSELRPRADALERKARTNLIWAIGGTIGAAALLAKELAPLVLRLIEWIGG